jgi:HEPN domain-containing protein
MNEVTEEWISKADNHFYSADLLLHSGNMPLSDTGSFHCQQCAEKYLKAFLRDHLIRFEGAHGLADLLTLCVPLDEDFGKITNDLNSLEEFSIDIIYPGAIVSVELAEEAFKATKRIRKFVRRKLNII